MADHWNPLHANYYKRTWRRHGSTARASSRPTPLGLPDRQNRRPIQDHQHYAQFKDYRRRVVRQQLTRRRQDRPDRLQPGWGCEAIIELNWTPTSCAQITHNQGSYSALIADAITRLSRGQASLLLHLWTPYWVGNELKRAGRGLAGGAVLLAAGEQGMDTKLPNGKNYDFVVNNPADQPPEAWAEKNPAAARLFEVMQLSVADINARTT